jgi:hypothetical protein
MASTTKNMKVQLCSDERELTLFPNSKKYAKDSDETDDEDNNLTEHHPQHPKRVPKRGRVMGQKNRGILDHTPDYKPTKVTRQNHPAFN